MSEARGQKFDNDKSPITLVDPSFITGTADVLAFGSRKYAKHNWRKGIEVTRCLDAGFRHMLQVARGEDIDPESGLPHLYHVACCIMFAQWMIENRPDMDDRWKPDPAPVDLTQIELAASPVEEVPTPEVVRPETHDVVASLAFAAMNPPTA